MISVSSGVRVAKRYSKNENIFVGFSEMLKKIMLKNWTFSKVAFISFCGRMLKCQKLKMGTNSKAQFTLTVRMGDLVRSSIQLVKSHADDLGLKYLWNGG